MRQRKIANAGGGTQKQNHFSAFLKRRIMKSMTKRSEKIIRWYLIFAVRPGRCPGQIRVFDFYMRSWSFSYQLNCTCNSITFFVSFPSFPRIFTTQQCTRFSWSVHFCTYNPHSRAALSLDFRRLTEGWSCNLPVLDGCPASTIGTSIWADNWRGRPQEFINPKI